MKLFDALVSTTLFMSGILEGSAAFFVPQSFQKSIIAYSTLPDVEDLKSGKFIDQVSYGAELAASLNKDDGDQKQILQLLQVQLSHSDGIRGFFVSYLTMDQGTEDEFNVPKLLVQAMDSADDEDLVPLVCMNVVMPTAVSSMHTEEELQNQSKMTASRGVKVLQALLKGSPKMKDKILNNCRAINAAASDTRADGISEKDLKYWTEFFDKYGYGDIQKQDIANIMFTILASYISTIAV